MFFSAVEVDVDVDFAAEAGPDFAPPLPLLFAADDALPVAAEVAADGSISLTTVSFFFPVPVERFSWLLLMYFLLTGVADLPLRPDRPLWSDLECFIPMLAGVAGLEALGVAVAEGVEAVVVEAVLVALGVAAGVVAVAVVVVVAAAAPPFSFSPLSCFLMVPEEIC